MVWPTWPDLGNTKRDLDIPEATQAAARATLTNALKALDTGWLEGSRFIAGVHPMRDESELPPILEALRAEFPEANRRVLGHQHREGELRPVRRPGQTTRRPLELSEPGGDALVEPADDLGRSTDPPPLVQGPADALRVP